MYLQQTDSAQFLQIVPHYMSLLGISLLWIFIFSPLLKSYIIINKVSMYTFRKVRISPCVYYRQEHRMDKLCDVLLKTILFSFSEMK